MENLKVRDCMSHRVLTFNENDSLAEALRTLLKTGRSGAPVVDDQGKVVGLLSEIDCLQETLMGDYFQYGSTRVLDHMSTQLDVVDADDDLMTAAHKFLNGRRRLPVLSEDKLVGIITRKDFAKALIKHIDESQSDSAKRHARTERTS